MGALVGVLDDLGDVDGVEQGRHHRGTGPGVLGLPQQEPQVAATPVAGTKVQPFVQLVAQAFGRPAAQQRRVLLVGRELPQFLGEIQPDDDPVAVEIELDRHHQSQACEAGEPGVRDAHEGGALRGADGLAPARAAPPGTPASARTRSISARVTRRPPPPSSGTERTQPRCSARSNSPRLSSSSRAARLSERVADCVMVVARTWTVSPEESDGSRRCALASGKTVSGLSDIVASLWITPAADTVPAGQRSEDGLAFRLSGVHAKVFADAVHQQRHLVGDLADVRLRPAEDGQTAAGAGRGDEEHRVVELDHRLPYLPGAEVAAGALGQAVQSRRDRGEVFGVLASESCARARHQPVVGQHQRVPNVLDALGEVVQQPAESRVLFHDPVSPCGVPPGRRIRPASLPHGRRPGKADGWHGREDGRRADVSGGAAGQPRDGSAGSRAMVSWRRVGPTRTAGSLSRRTRAAGRCAPARRTRRAGSAPPSRSPGRGRRTARPAYLGRGRGRARRPGRRTCGRPAKQLTATTNGMCRCSK